VSGLIKVFKESSSLEGNFGRVVWEITWDSFLGNKKENLGDVT
jgi:hypothetical protein